MTDAEAENRPAQSGMNPPSRNGDSSGRRWWTSLVEIGAEPTDSDQRRLAKEVFVVIGLGGATAGVSWFVMYAALGRPLNGLIPLSFGVVVAALFGAFLITKSLRGLTAILLGLMALLPLLLQLSLGGFVNGSAVVVWAFVAPLGALLLTSGGWTLFWFLIFLGDLVVAALLEGTVAAASPPLPVSARLALFALNITGVGTLTFVTLLFFRRQRDAAEARSEQLLLNVLPLSIATRLKKGERLIADHHEAVTVLFADLVGFTVRSASEPPAQTLEVLNEVFSAFDALVRRHGLEKIRTIGDSYMVAAGVPIQRADHARAMALMALDMQREVQRLNSERGWDLRFRIGLNSGPVVAGVIGDEKFQYDIWGDTVNTASRMESHGVPAEIQVTEAVPECLESEFSFEPRGIIDVKGKGPTMTYFLTGIKGSASD